MLTVGINYLILLISSNKYAMRAIVLSLGSRLAYLSMSQVR